MLFVWLLFLNLMLTLLFVYHNYIIVLSFVNVCFFFPSQSHFRFDSSHTSYFFNFYFYFNFFLFLREKHSSLWLNQWKTNFLLFLGYWNAHTYWSTLKIPLLVLVPLMYPVYRSVFLFLYLPLHSMTVWKVRNSNEIGVGFQKFE